MLSRPRLFLVLHWYHSGISLGALPCKSHNSVESKYLRAKTWFVAVFDEMGGEVSLTAREHLHSPIRASPGPHRSTSNPG